MELDKHLIYYHDVLVSHGLTLSFACIARDIYYTKENLDGLSENQMKNACIRLRKLDGIIGVNKDKKVEDEEIKAKEAELVSKGYRKIFDTIKFDFQFAHALFLDFNALMNITSKKSKQICDLEVEKLKHFSLYRF